MRLRFGASPSSAIGGLLLAAALDVDRRSGKGRAVPNLARVRAPRREHDQIGELISRAPAPPLGERPVPRGITPATVLALQRSAGNAAVGAWLARRPSTRVLARETSLADAKRDFRDQLKIAKRLKVLGLTGATVDDLRAAAREDSAERRKEDRADAVRKRRGMPLVPNSVLLLHERLPNRLDRYEQWLEPDAAWQDRSQLMRSKRVEALTYVRSLRELLDAWRALIPADTQFPERAQVQAFEREYAPQINAIRDTIDNALKLIDEHVTEPPPKPKQWDTFMGDDSHPEQYHKGTDADPIPIVFYKDEANYAPIKIKGETFNYPNGPEVVGRLGKYKLKVRDDFRFSLGARLVNTKHWGDQPSSRMTQVDINFGLKQAGASMAGKDGDHVRDLGFGGRDHDDNYWPLDAAVNRRPFLGWRALYGINYKKDDGTLATAPITALGGKTFKIKGFMKAGDGTVPAEGQTPDQKSGTDAL